MTPPSPLVADIQASTPDPRIQASLGLGALLEGGSLTGPWPPGDSGTSLGPFQIHLPAHPGITGAQANDPAFAVATMEPVYAAAAGRVPSSLWAQNPEAAAEQTAFLAERPAQDYVASRGQSTVDHAWAGALAGLGMTSGTPATSTPMASTAAFYNPGSWAGDIAGAAGGALASALGPVLASVAGVALGLGLIGAGILKLANPNRTIRQSVSGLASSAGQAAEIGAVAA